MARFEMERMLHILLHKSAAKCVLLFSPPLGSPPGCRPFLDVACYNGDTGPIPTPSGRLSF